MVPVSKLARPAATNTLQQRVTALDRSPELFSIQIAEAYSLLNIDPNGVASTYSQDDAEKEARIGFTPKEQWVLRWLLKRFEGDTVQPGSPCSELKAWILLRIVVARLPLTVTARLLSAHKFMSTVQKTLNWVCLHVANHPSAALAPDEEQRSKTPLSRESSSSTTVQEVSSVPCKKSKKRKRGQVDSEDLDAGKVPISDLILLYIAICGALSQILAFTNGQPGEAENFAVEHMRAAVKTSIEQSAKILGDSLDIVAMVISTPNNYESANYDVVLKPAVGVWSVRSIFQETNDGLVSARAFSTYCLVPVLRLLSRIQAIPIQDDKITPIAEAAERLIAAHIILPARTAFMRAKDSDSCETEVSLINELLDPLSKIVLSETQDAHPVTPENRMLHTIPMLFKYGLELLPRDTPKQRITEAPWLRKLFIQLVGCISLSFPLSEISNPNESVSGILECLLRLSVENNVSLDVPILESIVLNISGIYPVEAQHRARWSLVGLCMELSPDLAIPVRSKSNVPTGRAVLQPNLVLSRILDKLTNSGFRNGNETSIDYDTMLNNVLLRLMKSFINARDLLGFLSIWEQQIKLWEIFARVKHADSGRCSVLAVSIWEDEALLQVVAEELEQALTAGQISKLLDDLCSRITNDSDTQAVKSLETYAQLVVLDCTLDGVRSDNVVSICKIYMETTGQNMAAVLRNNTTLLVQHRWRVWRALATVASRFLYYRDDLVHYAQDKIALTLAEEPNSPDSPAHYHEALFAMRFVISAQEAQQATNQSGKYFEAPSTVIRILVDSVPSILPPDGKKDSSLCRRWDGQRETITTRHTLLLAFALQLTSVPKILSEIGSSVLNLFLRMVYRCAARSAYVSKSPKDLSDKNTSIAFIEVWEELVGIGLAGEYPPITREICHIVYNAFVQTHSIGRNGIQTEEAEYAIFAISRMSLGAFERDEREHIIRHVSEALLDGTSFPNHSQYLSLVFHSLDYPKKSMHILSDPGYLWNVADQFDSNSEGPVFSSDLISFRQLATKATNIVISDCAESGNTSFLEHSLENFAARSLPSSPEPMAIAKSILRAVSLKLLWRRYDALPAKLKSRSPSLIDMSLKFFEWLPQHLNQWEAGHEDWALSLILDGLETWFAVLESVISKTLSEIKKSTALSQISKISEWIKKMASQKSFTLTSANTTFYSVEDLVVAAKKIEATISPHGQIMTAMINIAAIKEFTTIRARRAWVQYLADALWRLDGQKQANLIAQLTNMDCTNESLLYYVLRTLEHSYEKTPNMKSALSQLFSKICTDLHQMSNTRSCILEMHCLDLTLKKNSWTISQWHIDSLLSTITITTARSLTPPQILSPDIFTCQCRLFGTVLALHRSKLGGRYHLVVPALQGLLRCFFTPYSRHRPTLPILNPTHASAYARLLTSLCDPSVSAVTRSKNRQRAELNDETKKARAIAGQHLQYLIMEFCVCQLKGRVQPEVRAALNPGLYAVFDAMGQEVMRTVNAALDVGGRAIFKVVYEDYRRFGRWKGG